MSTWRPWLSKDALVCSLTLLNVFKHANCALECLWSAPWCYRLRMYIRLIDSTLRKNEYLFRLNDQQKVQMRSGSYSSDLVRTNSDVRLFLWLKYEQFVSDLHHLLRLLMLTIIKKTLSSMTEIRDIKFRISQHILISVQVMISFFFASRNFAWNHLAHSMASGLLRTAIIFFAIPRLATSAIRQRIEWQAVAKNEGNAATKPRRKRRQEC